MISISYNTNKANKVLFDFFQYRPCQETFFLLNIPYRDTAVKIIDSPDKIK